MYHQQKCSHDSERGGGIVWKFQNVRLHIIWCFILNKMHIWVSGTSSCIGICHFHEPCGTYLECIFYTLMLHYTIAQLFRWRMPKTIALHGLLFLAMRLSVLSGYLDYLTHTFAVPLNIPNGRHCCARGLSLGSEKRWEILILAWAHNAMGH